VDESDELFSELERMAESCARYGASAIDALGALASKEATRFGRLVDLRAALMTVADEQRASPYLPTGFLRDLPDPRRLAGITACLELEGLITQKELRSRFARYERTQAVFVRESGAWDARRRRAAGDEDSELIALRPPLRQVEGSEVIACGKGYARLDPFLSPGILAWACATFPAAPIFVRLDPQAWFESRPSQRLWERVVIPANPKWWRRLGLYAGETDGGVYELEDALPGDITRFWEYRVRGVRRLESSATKRSNLSMMVEELTETADHLLGRCIHLDTDALPGTDFDGAAVNHLDLAMNVYEGDARTARMAMHLRNGTVENASFRTHLLRVEGVPLSALLDLATMFFRSTTLTTEWIADQFRGRR